MPVPVPVPVPVTGPDSAQTQALPRLPSVPHTPTSLSVSLPPPSPATETGVSVARACGAAPLGYGNERKCCPGVRRGTLGRRIVAEVFPGRATRHRWATEWGRNVAETSPWRVARHPWATETGGSVAQACGAFLVCKLLKKDASLHGSRNALWNVSNRLGWSRRKGMLVYPVLDVVLVSVAGVAGDHLTDESG